MKLKITLLTLGAFFLFTPTIQARSDLFKTKCTAYHV